MVRGRSSSMMEDLGTKDPPITLSPHHPITLASVASRRRLVGGVLAAILAGRSAKSATGATASSGSAEQRPNIIVMVLDDLDVNVVAQMPEFQDLLANQAITFTNFFVTTPLCAPSRASLLRGQYVHNHGMLSNTGDEGGFKVFHDLGREESTVATWLQDAGYRTALVGKYLNGFPKNVGPEYVPPGWDEWFGLASRKSSYFRYTLNENGTIVDYGADPAGYATDVLAAKAVGFIERAAGDTTPFFLYLAPFAPHAPASHALRHADRFADVEFPRPPSHNETDVSDKPAWLRDVPLLTTEQVGQVDENQRKRLRSLLPVLEMFTGLVESLQAHDALDTYILITSDNGWFAGEHRLGVGKQAVYEESIRVPLMVWGPGLPAGQRVEELALNIDLAPTIAELAGVTPPDFVDGRSLAPLLWGDPPPVSRQAVLIELFAAAVEREPQPSDEILSPGEAAKDVPPYRALRTADAVYVEYETGDRELYDVRHDPYQLGNLAEEADPALIEVFSTRLAEIATCAGDSCRAAEDAPLDDLGIG